MQQTASDNIAVFRMPGASRGKAHLSLAGAAGLVLVTIVGFFLALHLNKGMFDLQLMTTVPMLGAVGLFMAGWRTLRSPVELRLSDRGIEIIGRKAEIGQWSWDRLAFADTATTAMGSKQFLRIYNTDGRLLARLSQDFENFDGMVASIQQRLAQRASPAGTHVERRKARRTGTFLMLGGVLAWALAGINVWFAISDRQAAELMTKQGVPTAATIVNKFIAPDGRTHRVEYRVAGAGHDAPLVNVEIEPLLWITLQAGSRIQVIAVPGHPEISRLLAGQIDDHFAPAPGTTLLVSVGVALLGVFFFVGGILARRGIDIRFNNTSGFHVRRINEVKAEPPPVPPPPPKAHL
jgi:hypothetical protein